MKVLFLAPQLPWPLDQGARIRNYHLLRAVAAVGTVDLLALDASGEPPAPLAALCRRVEAFPLPARRPAQRLATLVRSGLPDLAHRAWQPALAARLRALTAAETYDVVHVSSLEMMPYRLALAPRAPHPLLVFDDLNAEHHLQRRACLTDLRTPRRWHAALYSAVQWQRLRRYEARLCHAADLTITVSAIDLGLLARLAPAARFAVLPNGVDTAAFAPGARAPADPPELLFTGTLDYRPNVDAVLWFAEAVLPRLRQRRPELRCLVVGKAPDPRPRAAAARTPGLVLTGAVPDVRPYLARAAVYVVPMRMGSGSRLKVLEALAAGVPVVSTPLGLEGISGAPRDYALVAATPGAFATAVLRLLDEPALAAHLAAHGRALVERRYDWSALAPRLPAHYRALVAYRRQPG